MGKRNTISGVSIVISRKAGNLDAPLTMPSNHFTDLLMPFLGKIGRTASEEVTLEQVKSKCLPILLLWFGMCLS